MRYIKTYQSNLTDIYNKYQVGDYIVLVENSIGNEVFNCLKILRQPMFYFEVEYIVIVDSKDFLNENNLYDLKAIVGRASSEIIEEYELRKSIAKYNL